MKTNERLSLDPGEISHLRSALDQAAIVAFTDARGVITYVNDKFCEISKYSKEELIGNTHKLINSGYHPPEFFRELWKTIAQGMVWNGKIKNRAKDGSFYWVETTIVPFISAKSNTDSPSTSSYNYVAIRFDITQQKNSEENFRQLFNSSFEGTFVVHQGKVLDANEAAAKTFQVSLTSLLNQQLLDIFSPDTHASIKKILSSTSELHEEVIFTHKNGKRSFLMLSAKPFTYKGFASTLITIRDDSEQRILQGKLAQQERLASVGFLASGLAHEIGTPLGVIRGRAEYLSLYPDNQSTVRSNMEIVINQIDRISKLIYSLLNIARKDNLEVVSKVNINEALQDVTQLLNTSFLKEQIKLSTHISGELFIMANKSQLEQIFLNLLVNSLHAFKSKGTAPPESFSVSVAARTNNNFCEISITDNGCGISEEHLKHIFEPFFTTKDPGHGTGLGLSIVQQIIFSWDGDIRCESQLGKGTQFFIRIPSA